MKNFSRRLTSIFLAVIMLLTAAPLSGISATNGIAIPEGAVEFNGHYYMTFNESCTWTEAKKRCEDMGGYLATVTSQSEQNFINANLVTNAQSKRLFWLGGYYDRGIGMWKWVTGEEFLYTNWSPEEPTGYQYYLTVLGEGFGDDTGEDEIYGMWLDNPNNGDVRPWNLASTGFICEWGDNYFNSEPLIERVRQYTYSGYDYDQVLKMAETYDLNIPYQHNIFASALNDLNNAKDELQDYCELISNDIYNAWQLKKALTGFGGRVSMGLGKLIFCEDWKDYLAGEQMPDKERYKDALKDFMKTTSIDFSTFAYLSDAASLLSGCADVVGDVLESSKLKKMATSITSQTSMNDAKKIIINYNYSNLNELDLTSYGNNAISKTLGIVSDAFKITNITYEGITNLLSISSDVKTYEMYSDFLANIENSVSAPVALRAAASELNADVNAQYKREIAEIRKELLKYAQGDFISLGVDALGSVAATAALGTVLKTVSVYSTVANLVLGVNDYIYKSAAIEGYGYIAEIYVDRLEKAKSDFLSNQSLESAVNFREIYTTLYNIRLLGETKYRDLVTHDKLPYPAKRFLRKIQGYEENKAFINRSINDIYGREFTMTNQPITPIELKDIFDQWFYICCPVDVSIYDNTNDKLVGRIVNDVVDESVTDDSLLPVVLYVEGDAKHIKIGESSDYRIEITATDTGEMTISHNEIDDKYETTKKTNYYDVDLLKGRKFFMNKHDSSGSEDYASLYNADGTKVQPSEILSGNNLNTSKITITLTSEDGGIAFGDGEYYKGDAVGIYAQPSEGYSFNGWYCNNVLLGTKVEESFVATESKTITAKFSKIVYSIKLKDFPSVFYYRNSYALSAEVLPTLVDGYTVLWTSSDLSVADVTASGYITVTGRGSATITATLFDSDGKAVKNQDGKEISVSNNITVKYTLWQWLIRILLFGWLWY